MSLATFRASYRRYLADLTITELLNEREVLVLLSAYSHIPNMALSKNDRKNARKRAREELAIKRELFSAETKKRAAHVLAGSPADQFALMAVRETRREIAKHDHAVGSATTTPTGGDFMPDTHRHRKRAGKICGGY